VTLYLASSSPRRAHLIKLLGARDVVVRSHPVEEDFDALRSPQEIVRRLALHKARALQPILMAEAKSGVILGADTIVVLNGIVLNKPVDPDDAKRMLRMLSGQTHRVFTGIALLHATSGVYHSFAEETDVTFRDLTDTEIDDYVAGGSPLDKAGAYGIQDDHGAVFISKIDGDYYNVVGLPLCRLYIELSKFAPNVFRK
jgi:nucleoside triphosphate pyrophosphatase